MRSAVRVECVVPRLSYSTSNALSLERVIVIMLRSKGYEVRSDGISPTCRCIQVKQRLAGIWNSIVKQQLVGPIITGASN